MKDIKENIREIDRKSRGFMGEFRKFIARGNVMDMAVGVIIGGAFGKISTSLVNDILMPLLSLLTGGTDNHLMLVDLRKMNLTGKEMQNRLDEVYITVNKNGIPNDPQKPGITSGIRIGTPAVTTRGLKEPEMKEIAGLIRLAAVDFEKNADQIRRAVTDICGRYPIYQ